MMSHHRRLGRVVSDLTSRSVTTTDHRLQHHHQSAATTTTTTTSNNEGGNVGKVTKQKLSLLISSVLAWTRSESSGETAGREKHGSRKQQQANGGGTTGGRRRRGLEVVLGVRKYVAMMVEQLLTSSSYSASSSRPDADRRRNGSRPHTFTSGRHVVAGGNAAAHALSSSKRHNRGRLSSAPVSLRGSPATSGHLSVGDSVTKAASMSSSSEVSTMEELQSAIQAAIAHCKNSVAAATGDRHQQPRKC